MNVKPIHRTALLCVLLLSSVALLVAPEASASRSTAAVNAVRTSLAVLAPPLASTLESTHRASPRVLELDVDLFIEPPSGGASGLASGLLAELVDAHRSAELLVTEPPRGPPTSEPETRIGAFSLFGETRIGSDRELTDEARWGCADFLPKPAEGEQQGVLVHNCEVSRKPITDPARLLAAPEPVVIKFPARGLSKARQGVFAQHLAEQEAALNRISASDLETNLANYRYLDKSGALDRARDLAGKRLGPRPPGAHAAHALDARAGGYLHEFAGYRDALQARIGSLWRTRWKQIQPGRAHRLVPEF